jgi:N-methylhydantoinase B
MPCGGGLGDPRTRDPTQVLEDVKLGLVTREAAAADYGVVIRDDIGIDVEATARRRGN